MTTRLTINALLRQLLPSGSRPIPDTGASWQECPEWPPDLFAVAATLAEASGCYAELGVTLSRDEHEHAEKRQWASRARELGVEWSTTGRVPPSVQDLWSQLVGAGDQPVCADAGVGVDWKRAAIRLLAVADEACEGCGFIPSAESRSTAATAAEEFLKVGRGEPSFTRLPNSLCALVSPDQLCVLPKALAPLVGCTLRSLSHHLALLPGIGVARAEWDIGRPPETESERQDETHFNVLVVPFPYDVRGRDFQPTRPREPAPTLDNGKSGGLPDGYFTIAQGWLPAGSQVAQKGKLADFIGGLIDQAQDEGAKVHAVVLPEAALTPGLADAVAESLAGKYPELELLICGTLDGDPPNARNEARLIRLDRADGKHQVASVSTQGKHHRWRVDGGQVRQYDLGHVLDPGRNWWEDIDLYGRRIQFGLNRNEAVVAALICEDLARYDPMLPVVAAIGPNLVVALLMDGPQLLRRWPGRYATVLAEDPGSSVLTVTSLGMAIRSRRPNEEVNRTIALWKDAQSGDAKELVLPAGDHALLLELRAKDSEQVTMDLRSDQQTATQYVLGAVRGVRHPAPPDWLDRHKA